MMTRIDMNDIGSLAKFATIRQRRKLKSTENQVLAINLPNCACSLDNHMDVYAAVTAV